jgi:hypothetical protein
MAEDPWEWGFPFGDNRIERSSVVYNRPNVGIPADRNVSSPAVYTRMSVPGVGQRSVLSGGGWSFYLNQAGIAEFFERGTNNVGPWLEGIGRRVIEAAKRRSSTPTPRMERTVSFVPVSNPFGVRRMRAARAGTPGARSFSSITWGPSPVSPPDVGRRTGQLYNSHVMEVVKQARSSLGQFMPYALSVGNTAPYAVFVHEDQGRSWLRAALFDVAAESGLDNRQASLFAGSGRQPTTRESWDPNSMWTYNPRTGNTRRGFTHLAPPVRR